MSVDATSYVVYGIKINDYNAELVHEILDKNEDDLVIADGMCGDYMVFGKVLHRITPFEDSEFTEIEFSQLPKYEIEYKEKFKKLFPDHYHLVDKPFKLFAFIHYS